MLLQKFKISDFKLHKFLNENGKEKLFVYKSACASVHSFHGNPKHFNYFQTQEKLSPKCSIVMVDFKINAIPSIFAILSVGFLLIE